MHLNPAVSHRSNILTKFTSASREASEEIHSYIAARDMALAEAEQRTSDMTLNRAFLANQMVESCLKPARSPYTAQCLPETEAAHERKRCASAKARLGQLRKDAVLRHRECAVAA